MSVSAPLSSVAAYRGYYWDGFPLSSTPQRQPRRQPLPCQCSYRERSQSDSYRIQPEPGCIARLANADLLKLPMSYDEACQIRSSYSKRSCLDCSKSLYLPSSESVKQSLSTSQAKMTLETILSDKAFAPHTGILSAATPSYP